MSVSNAGSGGNSGGDGIVKLMDDRGNAPEPLFFFAGERRGEAPY